MISHPIPVSVSLVHVVNIGAVVVLIQNAIPINVNSTGITLSVVVSVGLISVGFKYAVVTTVPNIVPVCIILGRVVHSWAVVPVIGDPIIVIIMVTFITQTIFVMIFLARVGKVGAVILLAVVGGVLHTQQVSVGPSIQVTVLSANTAIPGIAWLALAPEHGFGEDAQVDAVCIFMTVVATVLARITGSANLFFSSRLLHSSSKGLRTRETCRAGQAVVTWLSVLTAMDSVMSMAGIRDLFTFIDVFAGDAISSVAKWTPATLVRAIGEAGALRSREAWVGETAVNGALLFVANLRHSSITNTVLSAIFRGRVRAETFTVLDSSIAGSTAGVPWRPRSPTSIDRTGRLPADFSLTSLSLAVSATHLGCGGVAEADLGDDPLATGHRA